MSAHLPGFRRLFPAIGIVLLGGVTLFLSGCAQLTSDPAADTATKSEATVQASPGRPSFERGLQAYDEGKYDLATAQFRNALEQGLVIPDWLSAHKHLAFIHCVSGRERQCSEDFRKALEVDPGFELDPAEVGHPLWGPVFKRVKASRKTESKK